VPGPHILGAAELGFQLLPKGEMVLSGTRRGKARRAIQGTPTRQGDLSMQPPLNIKITPMLKLRETMVFLPCMSSQGSAMLNKSVQREFLASHPARHHALERVF